MGQRQFSRAACSVPASSPLSGNGYRCPRPEARQTEPGCQSQKSAGGINPAHPCSRTYVSTHPLCVGMSHPHFNFFPRHLHEKISSSLDSNPIKTCELQIQLRNFYENRLLNTFKLFHIEIIRTGAATIHARSIFQTLSRLLKMKISLTLAPIWLPHCPAWMWTISRILNFKMNFTATHRQSSARPALVTIDRQCARLYEARPSRFTAWPVRATSAQKRRYLTRYQPLNIEINLYLPLVKEDSSYFDQI